MVDWDTVRVIALSFPEAVASEGDRVAFQVRGKSFAWAARERDGGGLGVRVEREDKQFILAANPDVYFSSPHYDGWPGVQIRLENIGGTSFASGSRTPGSSRHRSDLQPRTWPNKARPRRRASLQCLAL